MCGYRVNQAKLDQRSRVLAVDGPYWFEAQVSLRVKGHSVSSSEPHVL